MIDLDAARAALPLPEMLHKLGLGAHAKHKALCPFHDDKSPSFSVYKNGDGRWHYKCHAGCDGGDEISFLERHLGLSKRDAIVRYGELAGVNNLGGHGARRDSATAKVLIAHETPAQSFTVTARPLTNEECALVADKRGFSAAFVAEMSAAGTLAVIDEQHIGFRAGRGWHYKVSGNGWRYSDGEKASVLVLGEPKAGADVFVCESSWDALAFYDAMRQPVVCTRGAGNHRLAVECVRSICNPRVILIPQNDAPGRKWARDIADGLDGYEVVALAVPAPHKDVDEWRAAGATKGDVLNAYIDAAPVKNLSGGPVTESASAHSGDGCSSDDQSKGISHPPPAQNISTILDRVTAFMLRYVVFPVPEQANVCALWVAHTYIFQHYSATPYMHICSPEQNCGKTTVLKCLKALCRKPLKFSNASEAALFRLIDEVHPTILQDEVDNIFKDEKANSSLIGILNDGYEDDGTVLRCEEMGRSVKEFNVYSPKAFTGIGKIPSTLQSRCIDIRLKRQPAGTKAQPFRRGKIKAEAAEIIASLEIWAATAKFSDVKFPEALSDGRAQDLTEPLLAIADAAGGDWPDKARAILCDIISEGAEQSYGTRLLAACREIFGDKDTITVADLLQALIKRGNADEPWALWFERDVKNQSMGAPTTKLARMLEPYGIKSHVMHDSMDDETPGYRTRDFRDAFSRYLQTVEFTTAELL